MGKELRARNDIPDQYKWNMQDMFASDELWEDEAQLLLDLAKLLGTVSTTLEIERRKSGAFCLEESKTVDEICDSIETNLISIEDVLPDISIKSIITIPPIFLKRS